jgi:hypothetical protein
LRDDNATAQRHQRREDLELGLDGADLHERLGEHPGLARLTQHLSRRRCAVEAVGSRRRLTVPIVDLTAELLLDVG